MQRFCRTFKASYQCCPNCMAFEDVWSTSREPTARPESEVSRGLDCTRELHNAPAHTRCWKLLAICWLCNHTHAGIVNSISVTRTRFLEEWDIQIELRTEDRGTPEDMLAAHHNLTLCFVALSKATTLQPRAKAFQRSNTHFCGYSCHACSSLPTKVRLLMVQTFIYSAVMYGAELGHDRGSKTRCQLVVKKALRSILALHPRDCSSDVLYGDTGLLPPVYSLMLPNCGSTDAVEHGAGRWPKEALRFSFEGSRGVGRPKVGTGLVQCQIHY
jgi:hypothetical protein